MRGLRWLSLIFKLTRGGGDWGGEEVFGFGVRDVH